MAAAAPPPRSGPRARVPDGRRLGLRPAVDVGTRSRDHSGRPPLHTDPVDVPALYVAVRLFLRKPHVVGRALTAVLISAVVLGLVGLLQALGRRGDRPPLPLHPCRGGRLRVDQRTRSAPGVQGLTSRRRGRAGADVHPRQSDRLRRRDGLRRPRGRLAGAPNAPSRAAPLRCGRRPGSRRPGL